MPGPNGSFYEWMDSREALLMVAKRGVEVGEGCAFHRHSLELRLWGEMG